MLRPPRSSKVNISFWTTSVAAPTDRSNSAVSSKIGVSMRPKPARPRSDRAASSRAERGRSSSGSTSKVPRGAWKRSAIAGTLVGQLGQERIARPLGAERRDAHVAGVDDRLLRQAIDEAADALEQGRPVAARKVGATDRALEEHVAGEQRVLIG